MAKFVDHCIQNGAGVEMLAEYLQLLGEAVMNALLRGGEMSEYTTRLI
jgi:hypothetical protein